MPAAMCAGSSTVPLNVRAVEAIAKVAMATKASAASLSTFGLAGTFNRPESVPSCIEDMDLTTIEVRALANQDELNACVDLQHATWGEGFRDVVPASLLKVAQRIGGVVIGAFDAHGTLLGFVFGLTGVERGKIVHWSDMLAVRRDARNLGLGRRLKEQQR